MLASALPVFFGDFRAQRETVRSEIASPSFSNSPWMRGAPQVRILNHNEEISVLDFRLELSYKSGQHDAVILSESHCRIEFTARQQEPAAAGIPEDQQLMTVRRRTEGFA
jgi:hypothetical protein